MLSTTIVFFTAGRVISAIRDAASESNNPRKYIISVALGTVEIILIPIYSYTYFINIIKQLSFRLIALATQSHELEIARLCSKLRREFYIAVAENLAPSILLSGGVDTSVIAAVASLLTHLTGFTVAVSNSSPDLQYAKKIAGRFNIEHIVITPSEEEMLQSLEEVIPVIVSFDPMEVHGSVAVYLALLYARQLGFKEAMTGDGGDELFAGYTFYHGLKYDELDKVLKRTWSVMRFSSTQIGKFVGIDVKLPYIDERFKQFAMSIDARLKVKEENGRKWGKWILRKAYEDVIPHDVIWREKLHIGAGTGIENTLPKMAESLIPDDEYLRKRREYLEADGVKVRSKEHLLYYMIFREKIGIPRELDDGTRRCPSCGAALPDELTRFCRVCGEYPIQ